jgi:phosphoribosylaminoimidazole-succinocarboxamide synthase
MKAMLPNAFLGLGDSLPRRRSGKVRDWYPASGGYRVLVTTDRLSAFDRVVAAVPWKGQVLNQLSAWWNEKTADIVPNHLVSVPDPNVSVVRELVPLPVEVVVRGYITGVTSTALWRRYEEGEREIYGYAFPEGLKKNQRLPAPIITPTTKAAEGMHDERLTCAEIVDKGIVDASVWARVAEVAVGLFERGSEIAAKAGVILVDTKYEFGLDAKGEVTLMDEIHTPDSSRFWKAGSYEERLARGAEPELFDKEFVRMRYAELGYRGDGPVPVLPSEVWTEVGLLYQSVFELLTGSDFVPGAYPAAPRVLENIAKLEVRK